MKRRAKIVCTLGPATGACSPGDVVVVVSGSRTGVPGSTDSLCVLRIER